MAITNMQVVTGYYDGLGTPAIETVVSGHLSAGWIPQGAPVLTDVYGQVAQSMVKSDNLSTTAYTVATGATPMAPDNTWDTLGNPTWIESGRYLQAYTKGDQVTAKVDLSSQVDGVLPVASGGTGVSDQSDIWFAIRPSGPTTLTTAPVTNLDAATKGYVDAAITDGQTYTDDIVDEFKSQLASLDGYKYLGELQSVSEFQGLTAANGSRVKLRSWYSGWNATATGSPVGGGEFIYMSSVAKSKHDGCIYFSPTVPYSTSLSAYVTGSGESDPSGSGVWMRDISAFTTVCTDWAGINDGATANSSNAHADALQKVFNAAAAFGKNVQLGFGFIHVEKQVTIPTYYNNASAMPQIEGYGINSSYLVCYPLGTDVYNITMSRAGFVQTWGMKNFQIREKNSLKTAYLMKMFKVTGAVIDRVKWVGGYQQLLAQSVLSCTWIEPCWASGYRGAKFESGGAVSSGFANPNANLMIRPQILSMENQGLWVVGATEFSILGGSLEGSGADGDTTFRGVYVQQGGDDGSMVLTVDGMYIESCSGFPFFIVHGNNRTVRYTIQNCIFNNNATKYPVSQIQVLGNNVTYPAGVKMILTAKNNSCLPVGYVGSASRPDVAVLQYTQQNVAYFNDFDNLWIPSQPPVVDPNVVWKPDSGFSFSASVSSNGTVYARRNVTSVTRGGAGVYTVTTNHNVSTDNIIVGVTGTPGYAILGGDPSNNTFVVRTYNASGTAADIDFKVSGRTLNTMFNGA